MSRLPVLQVLFLLLVLITAGACNQTTYVRDGDRLETKHANRAAEENSASQERDLGPDLPSVERKVAYGLTKEYFRKAPRCVMVLPMDRKRAGAEAARVVEDAVARHLAYRFKKVVPAHKVVRQQRKRAIRPDDLKRLGRALRCGTAMEIKTPGFQRTYAFVWAQARLPLALQLRATRNGEALWWGRHAAERSEGGLPLGLLSLPLEAFSAGRFANDVDVLPSMADDAARRVMESLPGVPTGS